ncbi:MAG: hypothetical protein AAF518_16680 [Spirochaetota bacterium]
MVNLFKLSRILRFFSRKKKVNIEPEEEFPISVQKYPKGIEKETEELRKKLADFLLTYRVKSGTVVEHPHFKLHKTSSGLYKLDGKQENGKIFSIVLTTGNHIREQSGKITGFLQVSEAELNRAIQTDKDNLNEFFQEFRGLELKDSSSLGLAEDAGSDWREIVHWSRFWREQLLLQLSPNDMSLLLICLGKPFQEFFRETATRKQRKIVMDELFFLNQGVNDKQSNPHSKNKNWIDFDYAEENLAKNIAKIQEKMARDDQQRQRTELNYAEKNAKSRNTRQTKR